MSIFTNDTNSILRLGVLGGKLAHTLSPKIHADLLKQQGIRGTYEKYEMTRTEVDGLFSFMDENGITGLNVTRPY